MIIFLLLFLEGSEDIIENPITTTTTTTTTPSNAITITSTTNNNLNSHNPLKFLRWSEDATLSNRQNPPRILKTPQDVSSALPAELYFDFLPIELADSLLRKMLIEAETWKKGKYMIFEREVYSPHTTATYVTYPSGASCPYQASPRRPDVRPYFQELEEIRKLIAKKVNERLNVHHTR